MLPSLITYSTAAEMLGGVSVTTVRRLVRDGKLIAMAISPRCHRVDSASVTTYIRDSKITPPGAPLCPSGKTVKRGAGASSGTGLSAAEALALVKRQLRLKREHERSSQQG